MTNDLPPPAFRPPEDWEAIFAADPDGFTFGDEPSQLARSALRCFRALGGEPRGALALDLGCGEGRDTAFLADAGMRVVARDLAPAGLAKLERLLQRREVPRERVQIERGDVRDFAYPPETFDLTLAANVYQFLRPAEAPMHIARLQAATKPGGICAVGVFSPAMGAWGTDLDGFFCATADELMALFPPEPGWLLLDRTDYWIYRVDVRVRLSFAYVIARKPSEETP